MTYLSHGNNAVMLTARENITERNNHGGGEGGVWRGAGVMSRSKGTSPLQRSRAVFGCDAQLRRRHLNKTNWETIADQFLFRE